VLYVIESGATLSSTTLLDRHDFERGKNRYKSFLTSLALTSTSTHRLETLRYTDCLVFSSIHGPPRLLSRLHTIDPLLVPDPRIIPSPRCPPIVLISSTYGSESRISPSTNRPHLTGHKPPSSPSSQLPFNSSLLSAIPKQPNNDFDHHFNHEGISRSHLCLRNPSLSRSRCDDVTLPQHRCGLPDLHNHQLDPGLHLELEMDTQGR
jgi:hypothetical protein